MLKLFRLVLFSGLLGATVHGQSLAEIARQQQAHRAQQQDSSAQPTASTRKVYTNEDMPKASSSSATDEAKAPKAKITSQAPSEESAATKKTKDKDSVEQLKAKIRKGQELI